MSPNRLLVVDDQPDLAALIAAAAQGCDYDTRATNDAASFRREFESFQPTLIALDLTMPGEDGVQLMRFLAERGCKAGILIVSGADQRVLDCAASLAKARGLRMLGTIPKPFRLAPMRELFIKLRHDEAEPETPAVKAAAKIEQPDARRRA